MAGFSSDEEAGLLMSKLSDPSITPDDGSAFRDRVMNGPPAFDQSSFLGRLAGNPVVQGAAAAGPGAPVALMAGLTAQGLGRHLPASEAAPFEAGGAGFAPRVSREGGPGLQPMDTPLADVQPAPPLTPGYGTAGAIGASGYGGVAAGGGLKGAWDKAQQRQLGALDERKALEGDLGMARAGKVEAVGQLEEAQAARQQRDAEIQQQQDADTHARFQALPRQEREVGGRAPRLEGRPEPPHAERGRRDAVPDGDRLDGRRLPERDERWAKPVTSPASTG